MLKKILFFFLLSNIGFSQLVINELDCDQVGLDIKEFIEIKSATPFFPLDGYILVWFNGGAGTGILSYQSFDLDGVTTDVNGLYTLGNIAVSPTPDRNFDNSQLDNGADAVAIYQTNSNFSTGTPATSVNLIDALVYDTSDPDAVNLLAALNQTIQWNENMNSLKDTQSLQRKTDGTFEAKTPTPRATNDGSGVVLNAITTTIAPSGNLTEGNSFTITFTTQSPVVSTNLSFSYNLANGSFTTSDFSGVVPVVIAVGTSSITQTITLVDDTVNEGDETMQIVIGTIPANYILITNYIQIRIHDNDNLVMAWGNPLNPTYGNCISTKPVGYYDSLEGKSGAVLKQAIQDIIANPNVVREHTYSDAFEMLLEADSNPNNSSQVWLMYVEQARSKLDRQTTSSGFGKWNREHIFPQSRGAFNLDSNDVNDGITLWTTTDANDITAGGADGHHIRAEDGPENSSRNNRNYGVDYNGPTGNLGSWKGDVARAIFYMAVRYNGLNVVNGNVSETPTGNIGDLATLLTWNTTERADDFEMNHNNIVYNWQRNRNPFVDYPELANYIWGTNVGQPWSSTLSTKQFDDESFSIYPNPANNFIRISGRFDIANVEIYTSAGIAVYDKFYKNKDTINIDLPKGIYFVKVNYDDKTMFNKFIIK